jgi:membrane associated rhomboid family serine protease/Flp pilus assembly protein TadD
VASTRSFLSSTRRARLSYTPRVSDRERIFNTPSEPAPAQPEPPVQRTLAGLLAQITPRAWVTPALASLIVTGFIIEVAYFRAAPMSPTSEQLLKAGADYGPSVAEGQWWRALSSMFLHAGVIHIAFNLWAFYALGRFTERIFGNLPFLALYLLSGVGGALASLAWHPLSVSVGASGAIFGVCGALLAFVLMHKGVIPPVELQRQRNSLLGFLAFNIFYSFSQPNIDMADHAGGLATGLAAGALLSRDLLRPWDGRSRRIIGALGLTAGLLVTAVAVQRHVRAVPEIKADRLANEAYTHAKAGDVHGAIDLYTEALDTQKEAVWLENRGLAYLSLDDFTRSRADFRAAHALTPTPRSAALCCRADAAAASTPEAFESAAKTCTDALQLAPGDVSLLTVRALIRRAQQRDDDAIVDANAALALDPNSRTALSVIVHAYFTLNRLAEANTACSALLTVGTRDGDDLAVCARISRELGDRKAERARLEAWRDVAPDDGDALFALGWLEQSEGRYDESLAALRRVVAKAPNVASAWNNLAWVEVIVGDFSAARADSERALALEPDSPYNLGTHCFALVGVGELGAAREACARAVELREHDNETDWGMLAFIDHRYADARTAWQKASKDPQSARELAPWLAKLPAR